MNTRAHTYHIVIIALAIACAADLCLAGQTTCWKAAETAYGPPVALLAAIAKKESGFNPRAINKNSNGSEDIGLMQINTIHLSRLRKYGISRNDLFEPCTNLMVGAWILANNFARLGRNWNAVGAYNVGCRKLSAAECAKRRNKYAWGIHAALRGLSVGSKESVQLVKGTGRAKNSQKTDGRESPTIAVASMGAAKYD